jgi:hypothetical protein
VKNRSARSTQAIDLKEMIVTRPNIQYEMNISGYVDTDMKPHLAYAGNLVMMVRFEVNWREEKGRYLCQFESVKMGGWYN